MGEKIYFKIQKENIQRIYRRRTCGRTYKKIYQEIYGEIYKRIYGETYKETYRTLTY